MSKWTIYHNPRCSKSRETLEILMARGISPTVIEYLVTAPGVLELKDLLSKLSLPAKNLVRTKEAAFQEQPFDLTSEDIILKELAAKPNLLERPIVVFNNRAVIARPPENVNSLFEEIP